MYLDTLESQLRSLHGALNTTVGQRKGLAESAFDLSQSLNNLSQVELSPTLSGPLASLSDLQLRIRDLYDRQAQQDVLTLGIVIDEYVRMIGSIRKSFEQRQRSWHQFHTAETDLQKRRSALDKLSRQGRSQQDRMAQLQADVADAERRTHQAQLQFNDLGRVMRNEIERFEREKVEDFRMGLETYLEGCVESQKEVIEIWETFLMQLDADDEEQESARRSQGDGAQREQTAKAGSTAQIRPHAEPSPQAEAVGQRSEQHNPDEQRGPILQSETSDASAGPLAGGHEGGANLPSQEQNAVQESGRP